MTELRGLRAAICAEVRSALRAELARLFVRTNPRIRTATVPFPAATRTDIAAPQRGRDTAATFSSATSPLPAAGERAGHRLDLIRQRADLLVVGGRR